MKSWKTAAHDHIQEVVAANPDATEKELRKLISAAYPWGERTNYPYKAWLAAVRETFTERRLYGVPTKPATKTDFADTPLFQNAPQYPSGGWFAVGEPRP
jgi:hypothetical protein